MLQWQRNKGTGIPPYGVTSHQDVRSGHERGDADRVLNGVTPTSLEIVLNLGVRPCPSDARMCFDRIPYCVPGFGFSCGRFAADGSQNNHSNCRCHVAQLALPQRCWRKHRKIIIQQRDWLGWTNQRWCPVITVEKPRQTVNCFPGECVTFLLAWKRSLFLNMEDGMCGWVIPVGTEYFPTVAA